MNTFIISGLGFLSDVIFNRTDKDYNFKWVKSVREAKRYKASAAEAIIEKHNLNAFVWKPYKETPAGKMWTVVQDDNNYWEKNSQIVWTAVPRSIIPDSDVKFLGRKGAGLADTYYSKEKAIELAITKNSEEYDILIKKIEDLNNMNEKLMNEEI